MTSGIRDGWSCAVRLHCLVDLYFMRARWFSLIELYLIELLYFCFWWRQYRGIRVSEGEVAAIGYAKLLACSNVTKGSIGNHFALCVAIPYHILLLRGMIEHGAKPEDDCLSCFLVSVQVGGGPIAFIMSASIVTNRNVLTRYSGTAKCALCASCSPPDQAPTQGTRL